MKFLWNAVRSLEVLPLTLLESAFPFCSLPTLISFSKHTDNICPPPPPGPKPGWPGHPFLSIHSFITFPEPAPPPPAFLPVALLKANATQRSLQATCLGCSRIKCRQVSGLRLHLHPAEISVAISVSKQHKLGCLELGSNAATDLLRRAGGPQAVPQHQPVQDPFAHPSAESWPPRLPPSVPPSHPSLLQPTGCSTRADTPQAAWTIYRGCCVV